MGRIKNILPSATVAIVMGIEKFVYQFVAVLARIEECPPFPTGIPKGEGAMGDDK
jgi:hypothetical protein